MNRLYANVMKEEIRIAIVDQQGTLRQIIYERPTLGNRVHHIYKGVVKNVLPGMSAAFLDIGIGQNVYLNLRQGKDKQKVHEGQVLMVQVVKEEMLGKSARVTTDISLAGHFMVLLPHDKSIHISKKITDTALRESLKEMAKPYLERGVGFILRTAAKAATPEELARDMAYLHQTWERLQKRYGVAKNGVEIYGDADTWYRVVRDYVGPDVEAVYVDDTQAFGELEQLLQIGRFGKPVEVVLWKETTPLFAAHGIEEEIQRLLQRRVELPSGGCLYIDHTEALTVIDVNSGKYSGTYQLEGEVARKVNREAAYMIAQQLLLRNIGGMILCDFIDMDQVGRDEIEQLMTSLVKRDSVKTVVCGFTSLGLLELTRKRERPSIHSIVCEPCVECGGTGFERKGETIYLEILRRVRELQRLGQLKTNLLIEVHPDVKAYFTKQVLENLMKETHRVIQIEEDGTKLRESYSLISLGDV